MSSENQKNISKSVKLNRKKEKIIQREHIKNKKREHKKQLVSEEEANWWKLDNSAIIYPSASSSSWPAVFRISAKLKETVKPGILQQSLDDIMPRFPYFNVRIRKGFFWYYLEEQPFTAVVKKDTRYPCRKFDLKSKKHLLRILYYKNKISFEAFHSLCDGKGAFKFFTTLLMRYFQLQGITFEDKDSFIDFHDFPQENEVEDAFSRYADLKESSSRRGRLAYQVKGTPLERGKQLVFSAIMNINELKAAAKIHNASLTEYLMTIILSICNEQRKTMRIFNRPVGIQLPIDIRRFYPSETLRNFSSFKTIILPDNYEGSFEDTLLYVRKELDGINKESLMKSINMNVKVQRKKFVQIIPLFIKNLGLKLSNFLFGDRLITTTLSNVGIIEAPKEFNNLIDFYECVLSINKYNKFSTAICTFNGQLTMTFTSKMVETNLFSAILKFIADDGVNISLISNKVV